jgi:hypothetical protein
MRRVLDDFGAGFGALQGLQLGGPADAASTAALLAGAPSFPPAGPFESAAVAPG